MNTTGDLILIGALAAVWLTAGLLADGLPVAASTDALRRRVTRLSILAGAGVAVLVAIPVLSAALPGESSATSAALLPAVPGTIVLIATARRLTMLRRAAAAFATAPLAPLPPALRAAAAHPLVAAPLQVTGLAALAGLPIAAGLVTVPGADAAGITIAVVGAMVAAIGLRHALRHSRLNGLALAPIRRAPRRLS